ncbi:hypothetical protein RhiirA5_423896 [Rhizophagus irregularis]|uniref:Uncharacterized protein n=1 Tax=Rhizophagus irregularis TaxID=588596 RepID=A0A2N0P927_9GLOM|nr:hypothetical protein RhiirA5_423896 [Rhizophagus irregularis]
MSNVHTLRNINDKGAVGSLLGKHIPPGHQLGSIRESELEKALRGSIKSASDIANDYKDLQDIYLERRVVEGPLSKHTSSGNRLGSIRESELEKALRGNIKTASDIANDYKDLQDIYLERVKDFNRICSGFNNKFSRLNTANTELKAKYSAEIKSLKSSIKILERKATLVQKASSADKIQILSLETKIRELEDWLHDNLKSIVSELGLEDKVIELDKKLAKEDILEVLQKVLSEKDYHLQDANTRLEKALSEKDSLLHEANARIKKHLTNFEKKPNPDPFETQVIGGTDISNTTLALPHLRSITAPEAWEINFFFFQYAIIFVIVLLIICILWCVFSRRNSSYNEEKNIPNYKIPLNRNQSYGFPIRYAEEPKDRTASYETLPYGYG